MKRGDLVELAVTGVSAKGDGVGAAGGRKIRVRGGLPGDRVEVRLGRKRKGCFEGHVVRRLEEGIARRIPRCAHFGLCGGCRWQDVPYVEQLGLKARMVRDALESVGGCAAQPRPLAGCAQTFRYRNKMEFSFGRERSGGLQLGLHVRGAFNRVLDVEQCWLQSELCNRIVASVRAHAAALDLPVYDLREHTGLLRFLVIRQSGLNGDVLVNLVVAEYPHEGVGRLVGAVLAAVPEISTWVVSRHEGKAQVAVGQSEVVVHGAGTIIDGCNGVEYQISPRSFFQTNSAQAGLLYRLTKELAGDLSDTDVLDLYCGAGGISLQLAAGARSVLGVESVVDAVEDARRNAERNGITNCEFIAGKAEDLLPELKARSFGLVVVDPPRPGLHRRVLESLLQLLPARILYVSCNPQTLAADLSSLTVGHYTTTCICPVDMFPHTPHCEAVCELVRAC